MKKRNQDTNALKIIEQFMHAANAMAWHHRPAPGNPNGDDRKFLKYSKLTIDAAVALAPYQSPKFVAVRAVGSTSRLARAKP